MSLRIKLYLPLLLLSALLGSYIHGIWMPRALKDAERGYRSLLARHVDNVADGLVPLMLGRQLDAVYGNLDHLLKENKDWLAARLFDADGGSLYPLEAPPPPNARDVILLKQRIRYLDTNLGELVVMVDLSPRLNELRRRNRMLIHLVLAVVLLFLLTSGLVLELMVKKPVTLLVAAARRLAQGDFRMPLPRPTTDELGSLLNSFVSMREAIRVDTERLSEANEQLRSEVAERSRTEERIEVLNKELEVKVRERTKQLLDAQEELIRREKLSTLGQVAGSVGHELRNPLGVMSNAVYYLQTVLTNAGPAVREYLDIIKSEIADSERIVSDLLDAVRTKPPRPLPVPAGDLIAMSLERRPLPDRVTLAVERRTERPVLADPLQMKQTFINLVNNAVDAMPEGGRLEIVAEDDGEERVRFIFRDTGAGIPPEHRSRLFLPLFTTKARGIGLGLAVVKNLTEANGGTVAVESEPGAGTAFTVTLPAGRP